jgi:uncharacterized protein YjiS (DUF1127 family)
MSAHYPVLPVAGSALLRAVAGFCSILAQGARQIARARRHRREAAALAGLDRRMLADIGISRSDLRDAFSEPFWEDPTALLRERALERRWSRALLREEAESFQRPRTDRPSRETV